MATMNITITVPVGTTNHGNPNLLCTPSKATDILTFYVVNYLAHAVTVKSVPGEQPLDTIFVIFSALVYPYSGILRGIEAICRRAAWIKGNQIQQAARAGALCMVVRTQDWKPAPGSRVKGVMVNLGNGGVTENEEDAHPTSDALWRVRIPEELQEGVSDPVIRGDRTVHGVQRLPEGYNLAIVPSNAVIEPGHTEVAISFSYSVIQALVSVVQVCYASVTLYQSRGDQLSIYGYASFGLTVIPYIIMSIVNLLGNVLTPDYATLYLVRSSEMREAEALGAEFDGVVGTLVEDLDLVPHEFEGQFEQHGSGYILSDATAAAKRPLVSGSAKEDTLETTNIAENTNEKAFNAGTLETLEQAPSTNPSPSPETYTLGPSQREGLNAKPVRDWRYATVRYQETIDATRTYVYIPTVSRFKTSGTKAWGKGVVRLALVFIIYIMVPIPYAVIAGLTHFKAHGSTRAQRVWTMGWLSFGTFLGSAIPIYLARVKVDGGKGKDANVKWWKALLTRFYALAFYSCFAIGGLVVVGQMLSEYGSCNSLS